MGDPIRRIVCSGPGAAPADLTLTREWLVTNGLGGYASATVPGLITRRYHGWLVAALPAPLGRMVMLSHIGEKVRANGGAWQHIAGEERTDQPLEAPPIGFLTEFRLECGMPVWRYEVDGLTLEKRIVLPHMQNTVHVTYRLLSEHGTAELQLRPSTHFHRLEAQVSEPLHGPYTLTANGTQYEICGAPELPRLRLMMHGEAPSLTLDGGLIRDTFYLAEASRGYESRGRLWSPGYFQILLLPGHEATFIASTEPWTSILALPPLEALTTERNRRHRLLDAAQLPQEDTFAAELVLAADQFVITPAGRTEEEARAHAAGEDVRTIIAGYHWFTDWGRDTMISLEGLTLIPGRQVEASWILRTFAYYVRDGLIPNMFPEGEKQGQYNTADATLWLFHAIDRYVAYTHDSATVAALLPKLTDIAEHHIRGTRFGIGVDPNDGLLRQGEQGLQLTWMDAKVGDWVVTPRRGKAVEINALWYNALRLLEVWTREAGGSAEAAARWADHAARARDAFNRRFWYAEGGYLYDVVDGEHGDDPACRPNQLLAISLRHAVLERVHWDAVMDAVTQRLLTPLGLRSLAPGHPDYKAKYFGDLRSRDAAYHQGTVWAWLIGPFVDAWLKLHPDDPAAARRFLEGFAPHLDEACVGSISEIFDAESPFIPRGCIAQAWSVAEVLRAWMKTAPAHQPHRDEEVVHDTVTDEREYRAV